MWDVLGRTCASGASQKGIRVTQFQDCQSSSRRRRNSREPRAGLPELCAPRALQQEPRKESRSVICSAEPSEKAVRPVKQHLHDNIAELEAFWHPKNGELRPSDLSSGTKTRVWLKCGGCSCGRVDEWETRFDNLTSRRQINCAQRNSYGGKFCVCRSIAMDPLLSIEWHPDNQPADSVALGSNVKQQWICSDCGHGYEARPSNRSSQKTGCPECAIAAFRSGADRIGLLKDDRPDLVEEYVTEFNLRPVATVTCGMKDRANWVCKNCGLHFQRRVWERVRGMGCPTCASQKRTGNKPITKPPDPTLQSSTILTRPLPESASVKEKKIVKQKSGETALKKGTKKTASSQKSQTQIQEAETGRKKGAQVSASTAAKMTEASEAPKYPKAIRTRKIKKSDAA